jgi:hypothetical protein
METGFKVEGYFNSILNPIILWAGGYTPTNAPVVGVDILTPSNMIDGGIFNGASVNSAIGIRIGATAYRPSITNNQFQGQFTSGPIVYAGGAGAEWGHRSGNEWDLGTLTDRTQNKYGATFVIDKGDANDVIMQWGKTNPGRMIAVGSGSTGYLRFASDTADGGFMLGATGNKAGFLGAAPVLRQNTNDDFETVLSRFGFTTASTVRATRIGLNPRTADTTITTQAGEIQSVDATAGPVSITLPATTTPGYMFVIKKTDASANAVTVVGTIDGAANYSLPARWNFVRVVSTSTSGAWLIVGKG